MANDQPERFDRLFDAILGHLEVGDCKVCHSASSLVFDHDIEQNFNGSDGDFVVLPGGFRLILRLRRRNQSGCQKHDGESFHGKPRNGLVNK
jgi:hypothetical protein